MVRILLKRSEYYLNKFKDFTDYLVWFDTIIMGFLIVTSLRYVLLKMFVIFPAFNKQLGILILFPLLDGCFWFFLRGFSHIIIFPDRAISFSNYYRNFALPFGLAGSIFWFVGPVFGWSLSYLNVRNFFFLIVERNTTQKMQILAKNAQLQMLRYQINPHFLFNSLNSVKALIFENPEAADNTITAL
jgi:sensor histidine kinase YesM